MKRVQPVEIGSSEFVKIKLQLPSRRLPLFAQFPLKCAPDPIQGFRVDSPAAAQTQELRGHLFGVLGIHGPRDQGIKVIKTDGELVIAGKSLQQVI